MIVLIYNLTTHSTQRTENAFAGHNIIRVAEAESKTSLEDAIHHLKITAIDLVVLIDAKTAAGSVPKSHRFIREFNKKSIPVPIMLLHDYDRDIATLLTMGPLVYPLRINDFNVFPHEAILTQASALVNNRAGQASAEFRLYGLTLTGSVTPDIIFLGKKLPLSLGERVIAEALIRANGNILSRESLVDHFLNTENSSRSVDTTIKRIRRKAHIHLAALGQPFPEIDIIATEYGSGYRMHRKNLETVSAIFHGDETAHAEITKRFDWNAPLSEAVFFLHAATQDILQNLCERGIRSGEELMRAYIEVRSPKNRSFLKSRARGYLANLLNHKMPGKCTKGYILEMLADIAELNPEAKQNFLNWVMMRESDVGTQKSISESNRCAAKELAAPPRAITPTGRSDGHLSAFSSFEQAPN